MDSKASSLLLLTVLCLLFSSTSTAFNITRILSNHNFTTFSNLLSQCGLAKEVNSRQTITVLAVPNGAVGGLSGKPSEVVKRVLSTHVILDYYDKAKLSNLQNKSSILTTLYQTSGSANSQQGFLNVSKTPNGVMFGSAAKGAPLTVSLEGSVAAQPYNISVLQVSGVIQAEGIENFSPPPKAGPPKMAPASPPAPADEGPVADETPTNAPTADTRGPAAEGPANISPAANSPPADVAPSPLSGSSRVAAGAVVLVGLAASIMGF